MFKDISLMGQILGAKWLRNQVLSNNIANAETPNYKRSDVSFEEILSKKRLCLSTTNDKHSSSHLFKLVPKVYTEFTTTLRNDGNNVDIDKEMVELTKNALSYDILTEQIKTKFQLLRTAINEGRR